MQIIEKTCIGKSPNSVCEDICVITDNFIAVIDGVTSKSSFTYNGLTTGRMAADLIRKAIENAPREANLSQLLSLINSEFMQFEINNTFLQDKQKVEMQAVCAIFSAYHREIWVVGDCQVMLDGDIYLNPKKSDLILSDMRALIVDCLNTASPDIPLTQNLEAARNVILPWIVGSAIFANNSDSEYGYAVINGSEIPPKLIRIIQLDQNNHEIILASDGYPVLEKTLTLTEQRLQQILENDPGCCSFSSTKALKAGNRSFDDRTYIRFLT